MRKTIPLFLIFLIFLSGCTKDITLVKDTFTNKTHVCEISMIKDGKVADCTFETKLGKLNGLVVLKNNTLYLYNKKTNQAIVFEEIKPVFGFVFSEYRNKTNQTKYNISYCNIISKSNFEFDDRTEFIKEKDMIIKIE